MKIFIKPPGFTSNDFKYDLIEKKLLSRKSCYIGRLDPMARGNMLFLENKDCSLMNTFIGTRKSYEFEIIIGLSTDTDDILGILDNKDLNYNNESILSKIDMEIKNSITIINQKFHRYSSYMLRKGDKRLPLWQWNKLNQLDEEDIPSKEVSINSISIVEHKTYTLKELLEEFVGRISMLNKKHSFRQEQIIQQWKNLIKLYSDQTSIQSIKVKCNVSSGFYIRELANTIKRKLNFPLLIHDINRTDIIY